MKNIVFYVCLSLLLSGCVTKPTVLLESEQYYFVPANTTFEAKETKKSELKKYKRTTDSYNVDASTLIKLQEEANSNLLDALNK